MTTTTETLDYTHAAFTRRDGSFDESHCRGSVHTGSLETSQCERPAKYQEQGYWNVPTGERDSNGYPIKEQRTGIVGWCGTHAPSMVAERVAKKLEKQIAESRRMTTAYNRRAAIEAADRAYAEIGKALASVTEDIEIVALIERAQAIRDELKQ